jgi:hypothetical protein
MVNKESAGVLPLQQRRNSLTSTFAVHWAHFQDARLCRTAVVQRITSRADVDVARASSE